MATHLVTGGCGFVGRNMVQRLYNTTDDRILFIDDLSVGTHPDTWAPGNAMASSTRHLQSMADGRVLFLQADLRDVLRELNKDPSTGEETVRAGRRPASTTSSTSQRSSVGAARSMATRCSWPRTSASMRRCSSTSAATSQRRFMYPSSSAAYPIDLQTESNTLQLKESDIDFKKMGEPDMTYGWSKLTGEFLAKIAASHYGVHVTCIRPFSGYGEDQDLSYPVPAIAARAAKKENPFEVWGTGKQGRDFVHIDDVLDLTLAGHGQDQRWPRDQHRHGQAHQLFGTDRGLHRLRGLQTDHQAFARQTRWRSQPLLRHDVGGREPRLESEDPYRGRDAEGV